MVALNIDFHEGYLSPFTRDQYPGAIENGARVAKLVRSDPTDITAPGTLGTVLGSIGAPGVGVAYFIEWDNRPRVAVLIRAGGVDRA